jgi:hypothetical protein
MLRERIPMLSAMTLDLLGAKMKCNKWRQAAGSTSQSFGSAGGFLMWPPSAEL